MRIAYVCVDPGVPVFGCKGSSIHCQEVIRALRSNGYDVELFATRLGRKDDAPGDLRAMVTRELSGRLSRDPAERERSIRELDQRFAHELSRAAPFDLVYERYSLWSCSAMEFASQHDIPGILEVNSPLIHEQKKWRTLVDEEAAKYVRGRCFFHATSIIAVSSSVADHLSRNYFSQNKTTVVPNGVNCARFRVVRSAVSDPLDRRPLVIGFAGTLKPWHGVSTLLDAFAMVHHVIPRTELRIVGDGPQRAELEARLRNYPATVRRSIRFTGAIAPARMPEMVGGFDIAVAPYPYLDDFYFSPLKIMEYMACGLPVIASALGQISQLIRHGENGRLVTPGCHNELADTLIKLCEDPSARIRLGDAARSHVCRYHTWNNVVRRILGTLPNRGQLCETG